MTAFMAIGSVSCRANRCERYSHGHVTAAAVVTSPCAERCAQRAGQREGGVHLPSDRYGGRRVRRLSEPVMTEGGGGLT